MKKIYLFFLLCCIVGLSLFSTANIQAQTLKHSYTFEDATLDANKDTVIDVAGTALGKPAPATVFGTAISISGGICTVTGATTSTAGYISINGDSLKLKSYSAITLEAYVKAGNNANSNLMTMLSYFGGSTAGTNCLWIQGTRSGADKFGLNASSRTEACPASGAKTASGFEIDDNLLHHIVSVLTSDTIYYYIDGYLVNKTATVTNIIPSIGINLAYLFKGGWNDRNWNGSIYEYNIYDGVLDAATIKSHSQTLLASTANSSLGGLTASTGKLYPNFHPAITKYELILPSDATSLTLTGIALNAGATITGNLSGLDVSAANATGTDTIKITSSDLTTTSTYVVVYQKDVAALTLTHAYTFNDGTANDTIGNAEGTIIGTNGTITNGVYKTTVAGTITAGTSNHILLPGSKIGISKYPSFTEEAFIKKATTNNFISFLGRTFTPNGYDYHYLRTEKSVTSVSPAGVTTTPWSYEHGTTFTLTNNTIYHIVNVRSQDSITVYVNGILASASFIDAKRHMICNLSSDTAYIFRSGYNGDGNMIASISEYNVYKGKMDQGTALARYNALMAKEALNNKLVSLGISSGTLSPAFDPNVNNYTLIVPATDTAVLITPAIPTGFATVAYEDTINIKSGSGMASIVVTSGTGVVNTYKVNIWKTTTNATLSDLTLNASTITGFSPVKYSYDVVLPAGTTAVPVVAAIASSTTATAVVTQAATVRDTAKVVVTAEDATTKLTYSVNFSVTPALTVTPASLAFDNLAAKDSITVAGSDLKSDIIIKAPIGITVNPDTITAALTNNVKVYVTYDSTTVVNDTITITSGSLIKKVAVRASSNAGCFTPLYATGNLIADPGFNAATFAAGGFGGWGPTVLSKTNLYCGRGSAYIRGTCWPNGGSLDRALTTANGNALKPLTKYRLRAMVKSQASPATSFQFEIEGYNGTASIKFQIGNTNGWKQIDTTFTTGATVIEKGIYFNSCTTPPAITDTCFIDNYELYAAAQIKNSPASLTFLGAGTKKSAITGIQLSSDITITAPAGFSVTPTTLLSTVAGDSISVTFDGTASASGYIQLISGVVKDSIMVVGAVDPTIITNLSSLAFDELNPKDSITVSGGNLVSDITITAPAGITVNPATIPAASASNIKVMVTYDGTSSVTGDITLTSGVAVKTVAVKASTNASCFTPLYVPSVAVNLVADPYLNSLSTFGGWGGKSINTDPAYVYCGTRSGHVTNGSIDQVLTGKLKASTEYRVKAMVYAVSGTIQVGVFGWSSGQADINNVVSTYGSWQTVDFTFTTGATLAATQGVFFNNADGYIDNFEIYEEPQVGIDNVIAEAVNIYPNPASDYIMIKGISGAAKVVIINIQGKTLKVVDNVVANSEINLGDLSKGSYIVKVITKTSTTIKKVLVK